MGPFINTPQIERVVLNKLVLVLVVVTIEGTKNAHKSLSGVVTGVTEITIELANSSTIYCTRALDFIEGVVAQMAPRCYRSS